jgi:hypothetical protein
MRGRNEGKEKEWSRRAHWLDIRQFLRSSSSEDLAIE